MVWSLPSLKWHGGAKVECVVSHFHREETTIKMTTIGIDLAKAVFANDGVDAHGKAILKKQIKTCPDTDALRQPGARAWAVWRLVSGSTIGLGN